MESKAWEILTDEEKAALSLSINHSKSSWQAGEILQKAHYKYLEIQARAKHFFKIFTLYFKKYNDQLIPPTSDMIWELQEFILCTIQNRMGYRETLKYIGKGTDLTHKIAKRRYITMIMYMEWLKEHSDEQHRDLHDLIVEFDRWNNFRILPEEIQQPSAFKRRNKTRLLKHLKNLKAIEPYHIDKLVNSYSAPNSYTRPTLYLPLISDSFPSGYSILRIKDKAKIVKHISKNLRLYMFKDKDLADDYAVLVSDYLNKTNKNCKQGQTFWPEFRLVIKNAQNYNLINNIIPRRQKLEDSFIDIDKAVVKKAGKSIKPKSKRVTRTKFWEL